MRIRQLVRLSAVLAIGVGVQWVRGQSCIGTGAPDYMCPDPQGSLEVYVRHEAFCNRFYKCIEGKAVEGRCPSGSFFNPVENLCCPDESLCFRPQPCVAPVAGCQACINKLVPTGVDPSEFFVCNCDGTGEGQKCPWAFDACTKTNVTLTFVNGRCQNAGAAGSAGTTVAPGAGGAAGAPTAEPGSTSTVAASSTTEVTTTTAEVTTTTAAPTTTTVASETSTTAAADATTVADATTAAADATTTAADATTTAADATTVAADATTTTAAGETTTVADGDSTTAESTTEVTTTVVPARRKK